MNRISRCEFSSAFPRFKTINPEKVICIGYVVIYRIVLRIAVMVKYSKLVPFLWIPQKCRGRERRLHREICLSSWLYLRFLYLFRFFISTCEHIRVLRIFIFFSFLFKDECFPSHENLQRICENLSLKYLEAIHVWLTVFRTIFVT